VVYQTSDAVVEALPIGNGRLGAMVFGGVESERLQLSEDTLWSGAPRYFNSPDARGVLPEVRRLILEGDYAGADALCTRMQGPYDEFYQPLGDLHLRFEVSGEPDEYVRDLDLHTAVATTRYRIGSVAYTREVFVSAPAQVLVVRLTADRPGRISLRARLNSPHPYRVQSEGGLRQTLSGHGPLRVAPSYDTAVDPVIYDARGGGMAFEIQLGVVAEGGRVQATEEALSIEGANAVTLLLATGASFQGWDHPPSGDPVLQVRGRLEAAMRCCYEDLRAAHITDHSHLFDRVTLDLGSTQTAQRPTDERLRGQALSDDSHLAALLFQYGRYLLIASSRPGTQPANLQGIWNDQVRPPWSSNWTININTEMNYWPAEVTNLAECHLPLFDLIADLSIAGRETAETNYGCRDWVAHHNLDLWRQTAPARGLRQGRSRLGDVADGRRVALSASMGTLRLWRRRDLPPAPRLPSDARGSGVLSRLVRRGRSGAPGHSALHVARE